MVTEIWVNIGSGNGLLPAGNKPLPEPMLTSSVSFCAISSESDFTVKAQAIVLYELEIIITKSLPRLPGANELNSWDPSGQSSRLMVVSVGVWFIQIYVAQATHGPNNWPSLTILSINQWSYDHKFIDIPVFLSWIKYYEWESTPASNSSDGSLYHTTCMSVQCWPHNWERMLWCPDIELVDAKNWSAHVPRLLYSTSPD